jgi:hypothetical protein
VGTVHENVYAFLCLLGAAGSWYSVWLQAGRPRARSLNTGRVKNFLHVQTGSDARPASYPMGTGGSVPGSKAAGA